MYVVRAMKTIEVNKQMMFVFNELTGGRAQIAPGMTQVNVGMKRPTMALTVPTWWWKNGRGSIYTSGNLISK